MKHFFIVHSNITWLITQELIKWKNLSSSDCLLLIDRRLQIIKTDIQIVDISDLFLHDIKLEAIRDIFSQYRSNRETLAAIDAIATKYCLNNEFFQLYLPHQKLYKYYSFFTHFKCQLFFYIEEGNLSYSGNQFDPKRSAFKRMILSILYWFFLKGRVVPFPASFNFKHSKYGGSYCLNELAFPCFPNKKLLPLPFIVQEELVSIQRIWVFGPYVEFGEMPQEVRLRVSRDLLEYFIQHNISVIHIKYHPSQYLHPKLLEELKTLIDSYSDRIQFTEIPQTVSLENIAISAKADFYLTTSSAAIYAITCGCRVFSIAKKVIEYYPPFQHTFDAVPETIQNQIEFIEI